MNYIKIFLTSLCLIVSTTIFADNLNISSKVSRTNVALNETFDLTISVSNDSKNLPEFSIPSLANFNIYSTSKSTNMSVINGKTKVTVNYIYGLSPKNIGTFTIPSFKLTYNGSTYETSPITITVGQARKASSASIQQTQIPQQKQSSQVYNFDTSKAIFVEGKVNKKQAYVNEKIVYTFSLFTSVNLLANPAYQGPSFKGFFIGNTTQNNYRTQLNGKTYMVSEISTELYPQEKGTLTIEPAQIVAPIQDFSKAHDDFFSSFFTRSKNVELFTDPVKVKVLATPANVDMVGTFTMTASVDNKIKKEDEPFELKVVIKGNTNARTIKHPELILSDNLKEYETSETIIKNGDEEIGKEFTTLIMPLSQGSAEIRFQPIPYFDTKTKQTKKLTAKNISFAVVENKDKQNYVQQISTNTINLPIEQPKQELQQMDFSWIYKVYNTITSLKFWLIVLCLIVLYFVVKYSIKLNQYLNKDTQKLANKKAYKRAKKYFQQAKKCNNPNEFYEYMYKGLLEYFASAFAKSADGLTAYQIRKCLEEKNINEDIIKQVENILEECTIVLYAKSSSSNSDLKAFYDNTFKILKMLEI